MVSRVDSVDSRVGLVVREGAGAVPEGRCRGLLKGWAVEARVFACLHPHKLLGSPEEHRARLLLRPRASCLPEGAIV